MCGFEKYWREVLILSLGGGAFAPEPPKNVEPSLYCTLLFFIFPIEMNGNHGTQGGA